MPGVFRRYSRTAGRTLSLDVPLPTHYRLLDFNDAVALIGTKPGYLLRRSIEQVAVIVLKR